MRVLVTGGAGFVGANLALRLRRDHEWSVTALDNLKRRGSELSLRRLAQGGVCFVHGDVRSADDLDALGAVDLVVECSAEPSVRGGSDGDTRYVFETNLVGTFNCLEWARRHGAGMIFLSTSRVYSIAALRALPLVPTTTRLMPLAETSGCGWSPQGIAETFPTTGNRSLYGATKLASELLVEEYHVMHGIPAVINRCGVISGPWQMGKVDQGFFVLWAARHLYGGPLAYSGFGGEGLQVRDVLHVDDLYRLVEHQAMCIESLAGRTFNVGGGAGSSVSLKELTALCAERTGRNIAVGSNPLTRSEDIPYYASDNRLVRQVTNWSPRYTVEGILDDVITWLDEYRKELIPILGQSLGKSL